MHILRQNVLINIPLGTYVMYAFPLENIMASISISYAHVNRTKPIILHGDTLKYNIRNSDEERALVQSRER